MLLSSFPSHGFFKSIKIKVAGKIRTIKGSAFWFASFMCPVILQKIMQIIVCSAVFLLSCLLEVDDASLSRSHVAVTLHVSESTLLLSIAVIYCTLPNTKLLKKSRRGSLANPMHERMKRGKRYNGRNIRSTVVSAATKGAAQQEESGERQLWPQL
jgi:hypothetical protein